MDGSDNAVIAPWLAHNLTLTIISNNDKVCKLIFLRDNMSALKLGIRAENNRGSSVCEAINLANWSGNVNIKGKGLL